MCTTKALKVSSLDLVPSLVVFKGLRLGCEDDSCCLLGCSSLRPKEGVPSVDVAILFEAEGFSGKFLTLVCLVGGRSSSLASSMSKDEGFSLGRTENLVPWREQGMGLLVEGKDGVYKPLCIVFGEGLVVEVLKVQPKDVNLEVCSEEGLVGTCWM